MGCGASSVETLEHGQHKIDVTAAKEDKNEDKKEKKDKKKKRKNSSSSSNSSSSDSDSSSDDEERKEEVITRTLLREYLGREINMLTIELTQPEVLLKQLLEQKEQTTEQLVVNTSALEEQIKICHREYQDLTNLQQLIQQKAHVAQDTWDKEQNEYVQAYNKHKQLDDTQKKLQKTSGELDIRIQETSKNVKRLLKLRKRQDHVLQKVFDGSYGSEREGEIEEYVDKMRDYKKNILNTKSQWLRALDLTKQANLQFWRCVQLWTNILRHQPPVRVQHAAHVANYLHAAYTNSHQAVHCMKAHTQVPYFTTKLFNEIETSRRNAYVACQPRYHPTFLQWLWYYQQNAAYLERWISKTLSQTIEGDLIKVNGYLTMAEADLRAERKKLIVAKVKEKYGEDAEDEVVEQEAEVARLSEELSKMQNVSIQTNVATVTVDTGTDSGIDTDEGPPPVPGSEEDLTKSTDRGASEEEKRRAEEEAAKAAEQAALAEEHSRREAEAQAQAEAAAHAKMEEEQKLQAAEEESRRKLEEAKAKIAALEAETDNLEKEKEEAEKAQAEALAKKEAEEAAAKARVVAEEAAANAAAEQKEQLLKEAQEALEAAERAKAEAEKWTKMAAAAESKASVEREASEKAALDRAEAEREAKEAELAAQKAKQDWEQATAERAVAEAEQREKMELAKKAEEEAREAQRSLRAKDAQNKLAAGSEPERNTTEVKESKIDFQTDIDSIMNDYKASCEKYDKKRGTEETRMDLDLQEKLRARRKRRRQQMKQKLEEQKLLAVQSNTDNKTEL